MEIKVDQIINIVAGVLIVAFVGLFIYWVILVSKKKETFLDMEKKEDRNDSNERHEIIPESLYANDNASSPYPPEPIIPFQIYDGQDIRISMEIECEDDSKKNQDVSTMMPSTMMPSTMRPSTMMPGTMVPGQYNPYLNMRENYQSETDMQGNGNQPILCKCGEFAQENGNQTILCKCGEFAQENGKQSFAQGNGNGKQSTFCTCGGMIHQDCTSTQQRVNNYDNGSTEFAKFPNKGWQDIMPYDQWTEQPNYYKQNTKWFDVMPYDIYESNKNKNLV